MDNISWLLVLLVSLFFFCSEISEFENSYALWAQWLAVRKRHINQNKLSANHNADSAYNFPNSEISEQKKEIQCIKCYTQQQ